MGQWAHQVNMFGIGHAILGTFHDDHSYLLSRRRHLCSNTRIDA
jgi:hypothetical protein